jgi:hypothetical protein
MRVVCIRDVPNEEELRKIPWFHPERRDSFGVETGREYLVLGLTVTDLLKVWVDTEPEAPEIATPMPVPLFLFRISDSRLSRSWIIQPNQAGVIAIWPPSWFLPYYHDRFFDGDSEIREDYRRVVAELQREDAES